MPPPERRTGPSARTGPPERRTGPPPPERRSTASRAPRTRHHAGLRGTKLIIGLVSLLVFGLTGYSWSTFQNLQDGLSTANVIGFSAPDGATDILLVGNDSRTDARGNPLPEDVLAQLRAGDNEGELTDTMILVRIPNDGSRAAAISLPRDLYVQMPDGFGRHKLNSAYARGKEETAQRLVEQEADPATVRTESIAAGRKLLLETIEDLTAVGIDHYAEINLLGFSLLTEAVGGVEVCLRAPVQDEFSGANFPAGPQRISGPDALAFVRQRHGLPRGDLDRVVRQQVFLASLADQVLSAGTLANPGRISELINATQQSLVLDNSLNVLDFATRVQGIAAGNVEFMTVPLTGYDTTESDGSVLTVDPKAVQNFVASAINGPPAPASAAPQNTSVTVDVLNASGVTGLAATVAEKLTGQGFIEGTVGNADPREVSVVRYPTGGQAAAAAVANTLGGLPAEENPNLSAGTVQVYLGEDYSGPGRNSFASAPLLRLDGRHAAHTAPTGYAASTGHGGGVPATTRSVRAVPPPLPPPPPVVAGNVPCID